MDTAFEVTMKKYEQLEFSPTQLYNVVLRKAMSRQEVRAAGLEPDVEDDTLPPISLQDRVVRVLALACKAARGETYAMTLLPATYPDSTAHQILYVAGDQADDTSKVCKFLETLLQAMKLMANTRRGTTEYQDARTAVARIVLERAIDHLKSLPAPQKLDIFLEKCINSESDTESWVYSEFAGPFTEAITDLQKHLHSASTVEFSSLTSSLDRLRTTLPPMQYWEHAAAEFDIEKADRLTAIGAGQDVRDKL
ncbi:hypothetical protein EUX98_g8791 [Antrodiella citrinella]|uniref:Uncharacterized protein n=1 Tax=Antrodiella citrinella TaxID=2447956 RepID=A0A4S4M2K6_9APHY|nr:hypothetical protein EUX98_g8791 [Antrodiella citrinella]